MTIRRKKIALIGAGNIGGTLAHLIELKQLGDVVLFDVADGLAKGKSLDIMQSSTINGHDLKISGTSDYNEIKDSDVVIVTAGIARKPGMSRDDLLKTNCEIIKSVGEALKKYAPNSFVIVITNPLDAMVTLMHKVTGFDPKKVVGMAGVLDTARFKHFLAEAMNISVENISSFVLGGHGDTMVPVIEHTSISGIKLQEFIDKGFISREKLQQIIQRTKDGGAEIVGLLKTGSAFYAPAVSAIEMAEAYLRDKRKILPCAAYLNGEYGVKGFYIGVPAIIGAGGVEKVIEVTMSGEVKLQFEKSVESVQNLVKDLPI